MSAVKNRVRQFPGTINVQTPGGGDMVGSSPPPPPLHGFFRGGDGAGDYDDDRKLRQAIEIRRNVTAEIFKEAMGKGGFGITYSTNLMSRMPDFIDYVMIEAALMKQMPEFSNSPFNVRAKTVICDSKVVSLVRWLKHHSLSYPQIGKIICLSTRNLDIIRRRVDWLKSFHVKGRFIGVVFMISGQSILDRSIEELDEIVSYLECQGVRRDWMGYVIGRCPELLSSSIEEVKTRVGFYMDMGMNENDFGTMVYDYPKVLGYFTFEEMNQKVNYLKEFGLDIKNVGRLLAFKPHLMGCSIDERWKPLIKYLYYLGINRDGMRKILVKKPVIFCISWETVVVPKVRFFQDIGIQEDAIGNMLVKFPSLLTYSLYKKIRPVVIFLITNAGVSQKNVGKVLALGPELLGCSIVHKLEVSVKYFLSLGLTRRQLGEMIVDFPSLLRYNIDLLRPKYRYLRRTMVRPLQDVIEFPRFFSYSLEDRIKPRHNVLVDNRLNFKLQYMLATSDEEFDHRVETEVERRRKFESGIPYEVPSDSGINDGCGEKMTDSAVHPDGEIGFSCSPESVLI